jgi:hypothetical protein
VAGGSTLQELSKRPWAWLLSFALIVAGVLLYLFQSGDWTWWIASAAFIPFALLVAARSERLGFGSKDSGTVDGGGPWTPP